jgi:PAS domain S-box-containing protein
VTTATRKGCAWSWYPAANEELTAINEELVEARETLATVNDSLEQKVDERTRALQESEEETQALNEELTAMNEEMAATNEELLATNEELAASRQHLQEAFDELRQAEEHSAKLAAIVESSDDAIIGKDLGGIVTSWNRGAENIFGYAAAEIIGRSVLELIPEALRHEEPDILARLRNGEKIDHYETTRCTRDGQLIQVALTISPIRNKEGQVTGVSKIARDITEKKRDEQRKSDFIGMVSHELKTPLTSLSAILQVAGAKLKASEDAFLAGAMSKANTQVRRMSAMINGFLNISRLESGKILIEKQPFELGKLIEEVVDESQLTVTTHQITYMPCAPVEVVADRDKLTSVLSNLIGNAVKYSPKGKTVSISCSADEDEVTVSVKDDGMGIKTPDLARIFDRYYRVETNHTQHISGFGIGLYLSAEIIQRHEGRIWAESESGVGSTFYFSLPVCSTVSPPGAGD